MDWRNGRGNLYVSARFLDNILFLLDIHYWVRNFALQSMGWLCGTLWLPNSSFVVVYHHMLLIHVSPPVLQCKLATSH